MQQRSNGFNVEPNESLGVIKQSFQSLNMVMDCATKFPEIASIKNLNKSNFLIFQNKTKNSYIRHFHQPFQFCKPQIATWAMD